MIISNLSLANIRIDLPNKELVDLIRSHLGISHFIDISDDGEQIIHETEYSSWGGVRTIRALGEKANEYEIEANNVCKFLMKNLKENLNVKTSITN